MTKPLFRSLHALLFAAAVAWIAGCGQQNSAGENKKPTGTTQVAQHDGHDHKDGGDHKDGEAKEGHAHGVWWCDEHGVPEEICAQCSSKLAAEFQRKKDWCEKHDRPDSQCFVCHPEYQAKFAAQYKAKYGKEPPAVK